MFDYEGITPEEKAELYEYYDNHNLEVCSNTLAKRIILNEIEKRFNVFLKIMKLGED